MKSDVEKFSRENKDENAREFLESLDEAVVDGRMANYEILCAVSTVLRRGVRRWWCTQLDVISTWAEFKQEFNRMYIQECDEEDLWADLRRRKQGERERTPFLSNLRYTLMHLREPSGEAQMARTAYRNLHRGLRI